MISRQGITVCHLFGFPLTINWSWFIFMSLVAAFWPTALVIYLLAFFFVTIHEYAHALTAQWCGYRVNAINLWPLGGIAGMEMEDITPKHELLIIAAGPASNLLMFLIILPLVFLDLPGFAGVLVKNAAYINFFLALFNMVPAFPMDGGRILRAILSHLGGDKTWATKLSVGIACAFAVTGIYFGVLVGNLLLIALSLFIVLAGFAELAAMQKLARDKFRKQVAEVTGDESTMDCQPLQLYQVIMTLQEPQKTEMFRELLRVFPEVLEENLDE
jgi:Zn-dependent protease